MSNICSVRDCASYVMARGWCQMHYARWRRTGSQYLAREKACRSRNGNWAGDKVSYSGAHVRCRSLWGSASGYACIRCGSKAHQWAYDGTDPTEKYENRGRYNMPTAFSVYPEFYMSLCRRCHIGMDKSRVAAELAEYRAWKNVTGRSLEETIETNRPTMSEREEYRRWMI